MFFAKEDKSLTNSLLNSPTSFLDMPLGLILRQDK